MFYKATGQVGPRASSQLPLTSDQVFTKRKTTHRKRTSTPRTCTSRASPGPSSGPQLGDSLPISTVSLATFYLLSIIHSHLLRNFIIKYPSAGPQREGVHIKGRQIQKNKLRVLIENEISKRAHLAYFDKYYFSYKCNLKASLHLLSSKKTQL